MNRTQRFLFVSNLKEETCDPTNRLTWKHEAYLLSERYATAENLALAEFARGKRKFLISDNGNFSRMGQLAKAFLPKGEALLAEADAACSKKKSIPESLARKRSALLAEIAEACRDAYAAQDWSAVTRRQLLIRPHLMVGLEDLTVPVMTMCGLMQPCFSPKPREVLAYQKKTLLRFRAQQEGKLDGVALPKQTQAMAVLHAYDYDSARQGGKLFAAHPSVEAVAVSFGAAMTSDRWIQSIKVRGKQMDLGKRLPEKYLLAHSLLLGAIDGLGKRRRLHVLGAGSPIILITTALALPYATAISLDSSAPLQAAASGYIYGNRRAYLKMDMYQLAAFHLLDGSEYRANNPFWRAFNIRYPSDWAALRRALNIVPGMEKPRVVDALKAAPELMQRYIPYFSPPQPGKTAFMNDVLVARGNANYWVLRSICAQARRRMDAPDVLYAWIKAEIERYRKAAGRDWAASLDWVCAMTELHKPPLKRAA